MAGRHIEAPASNVELPMGMRAGHLAGAAISKATACVAVVVSESAMVRLLDHRALVAEIIPELWLLNRRGIRLRNPFH